MILSCVICTHTHNGCGTHVSVCTNIIFPMILDLGPRNLIIPKYLMIILRTFDHIHMI
jgi:Na+-translocating ferredoxin:NAD+ oxidoreductase RnfE subunit